MLGASREAGITTDTAARAREENWRLVRELAADLGDRWDLEEATFELLCECGRPACDATVDVALDAYLDARSNGHDVVLRFHEEPLDLVVAAEDGYRVVARARSARAANGRQAGVAGDWTCDCGQEYRAAARGSHVVLWPRNSASGFRRNPIGDRCVNGCAIDRLTVLHTLVLESP